MTTRLARRSLVLAAVLFAGPAQAGDPSPGASSSSKAAQADPAQALFDAGVADMEAGRFEKGCPAIEASQRLDPRPGTLFTLAECEAQRGRVATSMRYYAEYLTLYRNFTAQKKLEQKERATTSEAQLKSLALLAPKLTLVLGPGAPADVVVKRDGEVVAELSLGAALAVDPGEHVVTTQAPGGPVTEQRISLAPGESKTLRLHVSREASASSASSTAPAPTPSSTSSSAARTSAWKITAFSAGAVGLAGFAVGAITGILAVNEQATVNRHCPKSGPDDVCDPQGTAARERLVTLGTASTVSFVVGGVGVGVGLALLLAAPPAPTSSPGVGPVLTTGVRWQSVALHVGGKF